MFILFHNFEVDLFTYLYKYCFYILSIIILNLVFYVVETKINWSTICLSLLHFGLYLLREIDEDMCICKVDDRVSAKI